MPLFCLCNFRYFYIVETDIMFEFSFQNITGFLFAFIPGLISISLVLYILISLPRNKLVNVFAAFTLSAGIWQISDAFLRISTSEQMADYWERFFSFGWIFIGALCLHFSLLYSRMASANNSPWLLGVLYLPSFVFMTLFQMPVYTHHLHFEPFWGWVNNHTSAFTDELTVFWISAQAVAALVVLFYHSYKIRNDKLLFLQSILIATGITAPAMAGIFSQLVRPIILDEPGITATSSFLVIFSLSAVIALTKFRLFAISELISNDVLLDQLSVAVLSISDKGRITYINKFGAALLGINRDNLQQFKLNKLLAESQPKEIHTLVQSCSSALSGEEVKNVELSLVINQRPLNILLSASPIINNNQVRGALINVRDISELKKSTQLIKQNESFLKEAQKISHIGSFECSLTTGKVNWSDELYRIYGFERGKKAIIYETIAEFAHPDDAVNVTKNLERALERKEPVDFKYRIITANSIRYLNAKIELASESPDRLFGTVQDITSQVESEMFLQQKNQELQQLNTNLEEFVFVASHDLKEPVRKIITFSQMITTSEAAGLTEKGRQYFRRMVDAATRMQVLIDGLLSLTLISRNSDFQNYPLQKILEEATSDLDIKIREKNATIHAGELPEAYIIPVQFRQLFYNLISNSLKFAKNDTPAVINITARPLLKLEVDQLPLPANHKYLKITLQDNGIGFENEYAEKIFQMFQRLHGKVDYEGTGIGLAICRKIVENHRGIISATGEPGKGAIFTIIIPQGAA